ncbi:MAG: hypothetical protein ACOCXJ_02495 [Planctomycetota bacterium]
MPVTTDLDALARSTGAGTDAGITGQGFVPKPVARILEEQLAAARILFGEDVDLTAGSSLRKIIELQALEQARFWQHAARQFAESHLATAGGEALSQLGAELGLPRPHQHASGVLTLELTADLPPGVSELALERGTRLRSAGGHDALLDERAELHNGRRRVQVAARAFEPGQDLDPTLADGGTFPQRLDRFHPQDARSHRVRILTSDLGLAEPLVAVVHEQPLTGGLRYWDDERYRDLLLGMPRSLWSVVGIRRSLELVPGVRQVQVRDRFGGLDVDQSIFGLFDFGERLFSENRDLASPFFVSVIVAPDVGAIWDGPGELAERVHDRLQELRPIGVHPWIRQAEEVGVAARGRITVDGAAVPTGPGADGSPAGIALKQRILHRLRRYVHGLDMGEPVRSAEILWAIMEESGVVDCSGLHLVRSPPRLASQDLGVAGPAGEEVLPCGANVDLAEEEIPRLIEDLDDLRIV